jgi:hypothetical protein
MNGIIHKNAKFVFTIDRQLREHEAALGENRIKYPRGFPHLYVHVVPTNPKVPYYPDADGIHCNFPKVVKMRVNQRISFYNN